MRRGAALGSAGLRPLIATLAVLLLFQPAGAQDAIGRFMSLRGEIVSPAYEGVGQNDGARAKYGKCTSWQVTGAIGASG